MSIRVSKNVQGRGISIAPGTFRLVFLTTVAVAAVFCGGLNFVDDSTAAPSTIW
jgi:hypothetical protein